MTEHRKTLLNMAKWAWLILVLGGVAAYVARNFGSMVIYLRAVSAVRLALSGLCLVAGKLLLVELSRRSVQMVRPKPGYRRMFHINSISQLAKYLPGGIWHFVGRAGFYAADGLSARDIAQAMVIENVWLVGSAFLAGAAFLLPVFVTGRAGVAVIAGIGVIWLALLYLSTRPYRLGAGWRFILSTSALQAAVWFLLGLSLWVMITPLSGLRILPLAVGAFGASWAAGYVAVFAPSGIGIREAAMVAILGAVLPAQAGVVYATLNRLVWVLTELLLGLAAKALEVVGAAPPASPIPDSTNAPAGIESSSDGITTPRSSAD